MRKVLLILLFIPLFLKADESLTSESRVGWEENIVVLKIKSPLETRGTTLSAARRRAERNIEDNRISIFFSNILNIPIDSLNTVSDIINREPAIYFHLENLAENMERTQSVLTTNLEYLDTTLQFPIYPDLVSVFYAQSKHMNRVKKLDHREYGEFSGLIIYVPEDLEMTKVLFPKIYDEDMNLVMDYTMVEPEYMKKWGMVLYNSSFDEYNYQSRVGIQPLRTIGKYLFGKNSCDIIISNEDADKLIGTEYNLDIVSQGRVVILH